MIITVTMEYNESPHEANEYVLNPNDVLQDTQRMDSGYNVIWRPVVRDCVRLRSTPLRTLALISEMRKLVIIITNALDRVTRICILRWFLRRVNVRVRTVLRQCFTVLRAIICLICAVIWTQKKLRSGRPSATQELPRLRKLERPCVTKSRSSM